MVVMGDIYTNGDVHLFVQGLFTVGIAHSHAESGAHDNRPTPPLEEQQGEHGAEH